MGKRHLTVVLICVFLMTNEIKYISLVHMSFKFLEIHVTLVIYCCVTTYQYLGSLKEKHHYVRISMNQDLAGSFALSIKRLQSRWWIDFIFTWDIQNWGRIHFKGHAGVGRHVLFDCRTEDLGFLMTHSWKIPSIPRCYPQFLNAANSSLQ